jgi:hypothetical protein
MIAAPVMAGLVVPAIHSPSLTLPRKRGRVREGEDVDARDKRGHDDVNSTVLD